MSKLSEAIKFAEVIHPLPRCEHGNCLQDHSGENLEPPCDCRFQTDSPLPEQPQIIVEVKGQKGIDISNLRFYAAMARKFEWQTDIIHWGVVEQTLNEIADRLAVPAETQHDNNPNSGTIHQGKP